MLTSSFTKDKEHLAQMSVSFLRHTNASYR